MIYRLLLIISFLMLFTSLFAQDKENRSVRVQREVKYYLIEGKEALSHGKFEDAIAAYRQCLSIDSKCATAHHELANIAIVLKDTKSALEHARAAATINPNNKWYSIQKAEIMESRGMLAQAADTYNHLITIEPDNEGYYHKRILLYETAEDWDNTIKAYDDFQHKFGNNFDLLALKQNLYNKAGRAKDAYNELKRLVKQNPNNPEFLCLLALRYSSDKKYRKAEKTYKKLIKMNSDNSVSLFILSQYYLDKKVYKNAYSYIKKAITSKEIKEEMAVSGVVALIESDTTKQYTKDRKELLNILVQQYPDNAIAYLLKASMLRENKQLVEAEFLIKKALEIDPDNENGLLQLGLVQNILKKYDDLYKTASEGINLYPSQDLFYVFRGVAGLEKKDYKETETALTTGIIYAKTESIKAQMRLLLADLYYKSGKKDKSFNMFEEELRIDSENLVVLNNYSYYLSLEKKDLDKAEKMSRKCLDKEPKNATYLDTYAWILYNRGEYKKAIGYMKKALKHIKEDEASAVMWEHYSDMLYKLGEKEKAIQELEKAIKMPGAEVDKLREKLAKVRGSVEKDK